METPSGHRGKNSLQDHLDVLENRNSEQEKSIEALTILSKNYAQLDCRSLLRLYKIIYCEENAWIEKTRIGKQLKAKLG